MLNEAYEIWRIFNQFKSSTINKFLVGHFIQQLFSITNYKLRNYQMAARKDHSKDLFNKYQCENNQNLRCMLISQLQSSQRQGRQFKIPYFKSSLYDDEQSQYSNISIKNATKSENKAFWTKDQDICIITCLKENGADWVYISSHLENRTPLQIKNHFSKLLRGIVYNINNTLRQNQQRLLDSKSIRAVLRACEDSLAEVGTKMSTAIIKDQLWRLLYNYSRNNQELYNKNDGTSLDIIKQILKAVKKNRKKKNSSKASTEIYMKQKKQFEHLEPGYLSDQSSFLQQGSNQHQDHLYKIGKLVDFAEDSSVEQVTDRPGGVIVEDTQQGIRDLLKESGLLYVYELVNSEQDVNKNQSSPSLSSNLNNEDYQHFYEQGELQGDCYWKISFRSTENTD